MEVNRFVNSIFNSNDKFFLIDNDRTFSKDYNNITKIFDVVIVGSGPAGISLALKLEKHYLLSTKNYKSKRSKFQDRH